MALRDIMVHDDDAGTTPAEIDASDFIDGGDVPVVIDGEVPTLMCIDSAIYDDFEDTMLHPVTTGGARWQLLPPTWPSTMQLGDLVDMYAGLFQDATAADDMSFCRGKREFVVAQDTNMSHRQRHIGPNTTWVNAGDSRVYAPKATTDFALVMHNQYRGGGIYPYRGGPLIHIMKDVAAVATADVWDSGLTEVLSDDTPALDPDKTYRLHALAGAAEGATGSEWLMGIRFSIIGQDQWQAIALGSGTGPELAKTIYLADSVPPFQGNRTMQLDTLMNATTDSQQVHLWLEEYGAGAGVASRPGRTVAGGGGGGISNVIQNLIGGGGRQPAGSQGGGFLGGY